MEPKKILLFLCLFVAVSGIFGQNRSTNNPLITEFKNDNALTASTPDRLSDGVQPMDTIYHIAFATRVDSLFKYFEKEPGSFLHIVYKNGITKPDLQNGDVLRVTSENGTIKDYYLKVDKYIPATNAYLGSITWPDIPTSFKGEVARSYGWKSDTIPSFEPLTMNYVLILPKAYQTIPALTFSTAHLNSTVVVNRAKSLEGSVAERTITFTVTAENDTTIHVYTVLLKKEQDTLDIQLKSTITSKVYKVSEGNSLNETIKGLIMGTSVADFYYDITKADELQTLKVISATSGAELAGTDLISPGDTLVVLSADRTHTSKYILDLTDLEIRNDLLLTSAIYGVDVTGSTGTISGFPKYTLLKTVLEGVVIPSGATLTMVDQYDAYKTLVVLNFDSSYVDVQATSDVYFEVVAENGVSKVLYQLIPTYLYGDANVTSDLYVIDPNSSTIYPFMQGTSVASLLRNLIPAHGATMEIVDKGGFKRSSGLLYKDDKLMVTSETGEPTKAYFFSMPGNVVRPYMTYVLSDYYIINQINQTIIWPEDTSIAEFKSKLYPALGATIKVIDRNGNESTLDKIAVSDKVLVTSADGTQTATYSFEILIGIDPVDVAATIKIFPNPTIGNVVIQGLEKGNRLKVLNSAGLVLHNVIADSSTQTISLDNQPAGIYLFVVSNGTQQIKIQKIVKK